MEEWIDITDFVGLYQISNLARVRSLDRTVTGKNGGKYFHKGKILKQWLVNGYWQVMLSKGGKYYNKLPHRLVAIAFIPNLENKPCINHKDLNKKNNNIDNLEWVTHKENTQHAIDNGIHIGYEKGTYKHTQETKDKMSKARKNKFIGENNPNTKLTNEKVLQIRELHSEGKTIKELAKQFGVGYWVIHLIIKRKSWIHI